ncbi:MAG: M48 family metalloprotease [Proteobacteria bacterium]|nr:M48 family metalloprotease [Pseudomonadota bacterium]
MRNRFLFIILLILACGVLPLHASYLEKFYPESTLQYWQSRYPKNVRWNFEHLLMKNLTPKERQSIGSFDLQFPLIASGQKSPINFYATNQPRGIILPILSIKLLDDVAIASAWLLFNSYSQDTIYNYMSMMKYKNPQTFPGKKFPPPLEALQIPNDALNDERVDSLSQKILKSAIIFIMAHELGHLYYHHPGYDIPLDQARQNELQADNFAMELMRRIGVAPIGITQFFMATLFLSKHRGDFTSDAQWENYLRTQSTHPLSPERIRALSLKLRTHTTDFARTEPDIRKAVVQINYMANQLDAIADILANHDTQKSIAHIGITMELEYLTPRPEGSIVPQLKSLKSESPTTGQAFSGQYKGEFTIGNNAGVEISMRFERSGQKVTGTYTYGLGAGKIKGIVENNLLNFQWQEGDSYGQGLFKTSKDGDQFNGTWGYNQSSNNGGNWSGRR